MFTFCASVFKLIYVCLQVLAMYTCLYTAYTVYASLCLFILVCEVQTDSYLVKVHGTALTFSSCQSTKSCTDS